MNRYGLRFEEALKLIKERRDRVNPNHGRLF